MVRVSSKTKKSLKEMSEELGIPMSHCIALLVRQWLKNKIVQDGINNG